MEPSDIRFKINHRSLSRIAFIGVLSIKIHIIKVLTCYTGIGAFLNIDFANKMNQLITDNSE